jgi:hypothetical protein
MARSLRVQSQQLPAESQVFEDEVLAGAESTDHPAEEMSERRDHSRNHIGKARIDVCAKSFILEVYEVLARHKGRLDANLILVANCSNTFTMPVTHPSVHRNTKCAAVYSEEVCLWTEKS